MQRAIEASTIFSSMTCACLDGELSFFASELVPSPFNKPSTVQQTLEVCQAVRADNCTSLAAALWPYYKNEIFVDGIVLVTDEEENHPCNSYMFAELFNAYKAKVNLEVSLVIICVGEGDCRFRQSLLLNNIEAETVIIDPVRPDLTKFDSLLVQVAGAVGVAVGHQEIDAEISTDETEFVIV
jgi:hypothetical protein